MAEYSTAADNAALSGVVALGTFLSLHTGDPAGTGANELPTGVYARKATVWGAPASGQVTGSAQTINCPSGATVSYWGLWSTVTGGSFITGGPLPTSVTFSGNGTYALTPVLTASG